VAKMIGAKQPEKFPDWAALAEGIRNNDEVAVKQFYDIFKHGFRYLVKRQLGSFDLEDSVHDCVLAVMTAVRKGSVREPERFVGFVHTIVKRHIANRIAVKISARSEDDIKSIALVHSTFPSPETQAIRTEAKIIARRVLDSLGDRDRDVLRRFYLLGQTEEQIRRDLDLSFHVFKNIKHRAKKKFAVQWQRHAASGVGASLRGALGNRRLAA